MKKKKCNPIRLFGWKKLFLMMRITAILMLTGLIHVSASVYSQKTTLEFKLKNVSVEEVLQKIEEQSNFYFLYRSDFLKELPEVSIDASGLKVEEVLDKIVVPYGFEYEIDDKVVVIRKTGETLGSNDQSQKITISGKVTDSSGQSLPGVTVAVDGTTRGIITDMDGKYSLTEVPGNAVLVFSFVGMKTQKIPVDGRSNINVVMQEETIGVDEVVVTALGLRREKKALGYSVGEVKGEDLTETSQGNVLNALAGKVSGVKN